ncbi:S8 family peptidase [Almyronema epifaneia]|uniref:S8 family peptidase n=1 Tax=Almyronema epifaneia S1 TaxID=2991925 RepID=A0ABW6IHT1_9CYAN
MKRLLWVGLFLLGIWLAVSQFSGLAGQGRFDSLIVDFGDDLTPAQIQSQLQKLPAGVSAFPNSEFSGPENLYVLQGDRQLLKTLRQSSLADLTEHIEPNYIYSAAFVPNDPDYSKQWNLRSINAEAAWDRATGKAVTVAVIDTGIAAVPDLKGTRIVKGYDFVNDVTEAKDDNGHGTHVAGTIAQSTNNRLGVAGVAFEAALMPLKVLSASGGGTVADIAEAIRFAADHEAQVINLSLGGAGDSQVLKDAIDYAHNKGVFIVAAAGNANRNAAEYPARYAHVMAVAATGPAGEKAPYSNYGAGVDIAAPGGAAQPDSAAGGILQNTIDPQTGKPVFLSLQGTSMAAPHVAGVAALVRSVGIENPDQIGEILRQSARRIEEDSLNHFGAGHLDAAAAVRLAQQSALNFHDFFRWLHENGYLSPKFWLDGGVIALWPKVLMVLGSYLLAWVLRVYWPFTWTSPLNWGLILGSSGLFFFKGFYIFDLPQWPLRVVGSSVAELGTAVQGSPLLNPIFASVLIPFCLIALLLSHQSLKWFAIGITLGTAACLSVSAISDPGLVWLGQGLGARFFLLTNALLCLGLAYLATKAAEGRPA